MPPRPLRPPPPPRRSTAEARLTSFVVSESSAVPSACTLGNVWMAKTRIQCVHTELPPTRTKGRKSLPPNGQMASLQRRAAGGSSHLVVCLQNKKAAQRGGRHENTAAKGRYIKTKLSLLLLLLLSLTHFQNKGIVNLQSELLLL